MAWLNRERAPMARGARKDAPEGLWEKCSNCSEIIYRRDLEANQQVCPKCSFHYPIPPEERLKRFLDPESFEEYDADLVTVDPLKFSDSKPYRKRLEDTANRLGRPDALVSGRGLLMQRPVQIGVFDFRFMGGSMGSVVGEKVARVFLRAADRREPAIIVSASGGARMQEGIVSLMQMGKTCAALSRLKDVGVPFVSIITHPTTGGVAASFALLGDVNLAEPGALIGFAGPRVIEQTIREQLPDGFQTSEFLFQHGMLDMICHRDAMRVRVSQLLSVMAHHRCRSTSQ